VLSGNEASAEVNCKLIRDYRLNVIMSSASCVHRLTVEAKEDLKALGVKYIILSAQAWTEDLRKELEGAWGAKVLDAYGANEFGCGVAGECLQQNGMHISEADFWVEVVDPGTGKPMADGEEGELVVTTLSRRGMPLVRYRIGDLGRFLPWEGRCRCGLALRKIGRIKGRVDDIVMVGTGGNVFPDEFDKALLGTAGVTDYQLVIEREAYKDVLHLTVETETRGEALREAMTKALKEVLYVRLGLEDSQTIKIGRVEGVSRGVLTSDRPKSQRIVNKRDFTDRY
jgi:phenylacetate-CoA ligase